MNREAIVGRVLIATGGLLFAACGGAPAPNQKLTSAESAVRAAEVGGAEEIPQGELHLKYARDLITKARALMAKEENEKAGLLLEQAQVDAEMALALAEEGEARRAAEEQMARIAELKEDN